MPPFDLDLLAITMTCSASLVFFPPRYHWKVSGMCDCFISLYYISLFVTLSKEQRYKTSHFCHPSFCVVSCFSFLGMSSIENELFLPILSHSDPFHQITYIFPSVRPLIFFEVSIVNSNYRGLCPFAHRIKYYTFMCIELTDTHFLGSSPVRRIKYRNLESTAF